MNYVWRYGSHQQVIYERCGSSGLHILGCISYSGQLIRCWHHGQHLIQLRGLLLDVLVLMEQLGHPVSVLWWGLGTNNEASRGQLGQRSRLLLLLLWHNRDRVVVRWHLLGILYGFSLSSVQLSKTYLYLWGLLSPLCSCEGLEIVRILDSSLCSTLLFISSSTRAILQFFKEFLSLMLRHVLQVSLKFGLSGSPISVFVLVESCYPIEPVLCATVWVSLVAIRFDDGDLRGWSRLSWVRRPGLQRCTLRKKHGSELFVRDLRDVVLRCEEILQFLPEEPIN